MEVIGVRTASLGDATYLVIVGDHAVVVDPQRDLARFEAILDERGVSVTHVLETHMHNDYISGGRDLARKTGAELVMPAGSGAGFAFVPAFHKEAFSGPGGITIEPIHTPGHTPAHTSYLVHLEGKPSALFSGGSLLVGAAGRSDLLGIEYANQLSHLQFGSVQRLAQLPDETGLYPTHGEGSFCTASGAGRTTSTIGLEKAENRVLAFADAESFVENQLGGLVPYPSYYRHMGPTNRTNPTEYVAGEVPEMSPTELTEHQASGGTVLDGRERHAFARAHVPGSIGIELGDSFAPWAGWVLDYETPVALVLDPGEDAQMAATELARIGMKVAGVMPGMDGWIAAGREVRSYRTASITELTAAMEGGEELEILDVRDPLEWEAGHIPGSVHRYVPDLADGVPEGIDTTRPVWLVCRTGNRASIAAGMLEAFDLDLVVVTKGGVPDVVG